MSDPVTGVSGLPPESEGTAGSHPDDPETRPTYWLRLYVAGQTPRSVRAIENLRRVCEEHLAGEYSIELIDLLENPARARADEIIAVPTLVRRLPPPIRKIIGDLSDTERVLVGLHLQARGER